MNTHQLLLDKAAVTAIRTLQSRGYSAQNVYNTMLQMQIEREELARITETIVVAPKVRSCNRHDDCDKAEAEYEKKNGSRPYGSFHCHDDCCEECFGN